MHRKRTIRWAAACMAALAACAGAETPKGRWDAAMDSFAKQDAAAPPKAGGIVFAGSSTILFWKLDASFPGLSALNRGFGGSTMADLLHYFDRVVMPYAPRTLVVYSGDNDIGGGTDPEAVAAQFAEFEGKVHAAFPECELILLGIKPSVLRWKLWPQMQQANAAMKTHCEKTPHCRYVDTAPASLNEQGEPRRELLQFDGLHLNEAGYAAWSELLRPLLTAPAAP